MKININQFDLFHSNQNSNNRLQPAFNLKFVIPVCTINRIVCGRGSAKARYPPINGWVISRTLRGNTKKAAVCRLLSKTACLGFRLPYFGY